MCLRAFVYNAHVKCVIIMMIMKQCVREPQKNVRKACYRFFIIAKNLAKRQFCGIYARERNTLYSKTLKKLNKRKIRAHTHTHGMHICMDYTLCVLHDS